MRTTLSHLMSSTAVRQAPQETGNGISDMSADAGGVLTLANKTHESNVFNETLDKLLNAKDDVDYGPVEMLGILQGMYGDDLDGFAALNTDEAKSNRPAEKYKVKVTKAGETKYEFRNWYTVFYENTNAGHYQASRERDVSEALKAPANRDESKIKDKEVLEHKNDPTWLLAEKKYIGGRKVAGRKLIRTAAAICFAWQALDAEGIGIDWVMYKDHQGRMQLKRTKYPIKLFDEETNAQTVVSISDLMKLGNPETIGKIRERGDVNLDTLTAALSRQGKSGQGGAATEVKIETADTFLTAAIAMNNYADYESDDGREHHQALLKKLQGKNSDEAVLAVGSLIHNLRAMFKPYEGRYERLLEANAKALGAETKAA